MRIHRDERGQTLILVALSLPILLGFIGLATDVGALLMDKRQIQTAADAAAIAGALNYKYGTYIAAAKDASKANGFQDGSNGVTVTPIDGPAWAYSNYKGVPGYIEVTVTKPESTIFLSLFGYSSVTVSARAVATDQGQGTGCLYTLQQSGTGFQTNGSVDLEAPNCGIVVDSDDPAQAMVVKGGKKMVIKVGSIGVVGGYSSSGSPDVEPNPSTGVVPYTDPLGYLPQYTCTTTSCTPSGGGSSVSCSAPPKNLPSVLPSGCYNGLTFGSTPVTLSGLYIINGDLIFGTNSNVTGTGVTLYYNGAISMNANSTVNLAAPNDVTNTWNGVLLAQSSTDPNTDVHIAGNASSVFKGIVYAPNLDLTLTGTPSMTVDAAYVVKSITLKGDVSFTSYASLSGVTSPLNSIALVE